jgi:hypothetical protein
VLELGAREREPVRALGDLCLAPEAAVSGVVVDAEGWPVEDAALELLALDATESASEGGARAAPRRAGTLDAGLRVEPGRHLARSGVAGEFRIGGLAAGRHRLRVRRGGTVLAERALALAPGEAADVRLELPATCLALAGLVRDARGACPGATVAVEREGVVARVTADALGRFRVAGLDARAPYRLRASVEAQHAAEADAWAGDTLVLHLPAPAPR